MAPKGGPVGRRKEMKLILALVLASSPVAVLAQGAPCEAPAYCSELKRVAALATTRERFASIAGKPREGGFHETTLPLTGWRDCALYGAATYTCDSLEHD